MFHNNPTPPPITVSNDPHFLQIQEAFLKQHSLNEKFDERIGYLETTTDRIDTNVDKVLEFMEQNFSNKSPRYTDNMLCDTEDFPNLSSQLPMLGKRQQCLPYTYPSPRQRSLWATL